MERVIDIPMSRLLGVMVSVSIAGRDGKTRVGMLECNIPLPIESTEGKGQIFISLVTTEQTLELNPAEIPMLGNGLKYGRFVPWICHEILYEALGKVDQGELYPSRVGRKIRHMLPEDGAEVEVTKDFKKISE